VYATKVTRSWVLSIIRAVTITILYTAPLHVHTITMWINSDGYSPVAKVFVMATERAATKHPMKMKNRDFATT